MPDAFRDADGASQFARPTVFTSRRVLAAEDTLLALADDRTGPAVAEHRADAVAARTAARAGLTRWPREDQAPAAVAVVTSGRVVDVLVGPAGTGKTTSMAGVRAMWEAEHGPGTRGRVGAVGDGRAGPGRATWGSSPTTPPNGSPSNTSSPPASSGSPP